MLKCLFIICSVAAISACSVTTEPLTLDDLQSIKSARVEALDQDQEPVTQPITLYEAMARAIKYNLDYKVEIYEEALRVSEAELLSMDMLPQLVASAGLNNRDKYNASRSGELINNSSVGDPSDTPTTSSDRSVVDASLTLSWDILDFGLSYVRAKQSADRALIANERKRKIISTEEP